MRAAVYERRGPAAEVLQIVDLEDPAPGAGEVRVRLAVSAINPSDTKSRSGTSSGQAGASDPLPWPRQIPHQDGAGTIDAVGPGVDAGRIGERVWVYHAAFGRPAGTAAEYVCVPARQAVALPEGIAITQAAAIGIPYITAHRCLFADGGLEGATVLVTGGAGAVGNAAIQLARWRGARVLSTVSSPQKGAIAEAAGAEATIDYRVTDVAERIAAAAPDGIDRVVDVSLTTNLPTFQEALAPHAVVAAYAEIAGRTGPAWPPPMKLRVKNTTLRFVRAYGLTQAMLDQATADVTAALAAGALRPLPEHRFTLDDIVAAHEAVERGVVGKVLVELP